MIRPFSGAPPTCQLPPALTLIRRLKFSTTEASPLKLRRILLESSLLTSRCCSWRGMPNNCVARSTRVRPGWHEAGRPNTILGHYTSRPPTFSFLYRSAQHRILASPPFSEKSQKRFAGSFVITFLLASACSITGCDDNQQTHGGREKNCAHANRFGRGGQGGWKDRVRAEKII